MDKGKDDRMSRFPPRWSLYSIWTPLTPGSRMIALKSLSLETRSTFVELAINR